MQFYYDDLARVFRGVFTEMKKNNFNSAGAASKIETTGTHGLGL